MATATESPGSSDILNLHCADLVRISYGHEIIVIQGFFHANCGLRGGRLIGTASTTNLCLSMNVKSTRSLHNPSR